jgi:N-acetylglucosamine-6-phosphate deacetylase
MAEGVAKNGVTSFLPTTMTVSYDELHAAFAQIRRAMAESASDNWQGAQILGVNAEGPFINPSKKGAQAGENIRPGDADFLKEYLDIIRVFTIAPEMPGNLECIREMAGKCLISCASSEGRAVIVVILGTTSRNIWPESLKYLRWALHGA